MNAYYNIIKIIKLISIKYYLKKKCFSHREEYFSLIQFKALIKIYTNKLFDVIYVHYVIKHKIN